MSLSNLRSLAKAQLPMGHALAAFTDANNGQLPTGMAQLKSYLQNAFANPAPDDATIDTILARYKVVRSGNVSNYPSGTYFVVEKAPVDRDYDTRVKYGLNSDSVIGTGIQESGDPDDPSY